MISLDENAENWKTKTILEKTEIIENNIQNNLCNQMENLSSIPEKNEDSDDTESNKVEKLKNVEHFEKTGDLKPKANNEKNQQSKTDDENSEGDLFNAPTKKDEGIVILGELFRFVREKGLKFLISEMRRIKKVSVLENSVEIIFDDLPDTMVQNHLKIAFDEFFGKKNLDYKLSGNNVSNDIEFEINRINELFGGKLIVKDE